jgi:hypothetical protein
MSSIQELREWRSLVPLDPKREPNILRVLNLASQEFLKGTMLQLQPVDLTAPDYGWKTVFELPPINLICSPLPLVQDIDSLSRYYYSQFATHNIWPYAGLGATGFSSTPQTRFVYHNAPYGVAGLTTLFPRRQFESNPLDDVEKRNRAWLVILAMARRLSRLSRSGEYGAALDAKVRSTVAQGDRLLKRIAAPRTSKVNKLLPRAVWLGSLKKTKYGSADETPEVIPWTRSSLPPRSTLPAPVARAS